VPDDSGAFREVLVSSWSHLSGRIGSTAMASDPQAKARKAVRRAQADFEKAQDKLEALRESRQKSFKDAQSAGL